MAKTLTIRLDRAGSELVEWAKEATMQNTASKAVLESLARYRRQEEREAALRAEAESRRERFEDYASEIRNTGQRLKRLEEAMREEAMQWRREDSGQQRMELP